MYKDTQKVVLIVTCQTFEASQWEKEVDNVSVEIVSSSLFLQLFCNKLYIKDYIDHWFLFILS